MFLREIELINFMCHEYLKFSPQKITLLFGQNGSGKSAILEAINLAFGGLGRERQDLLRNFIKHGKELAIIRLYISNAVALPGRGIVLLDPSLPYDADIIVERVITQDASYFKLNGRRTTRERVLQILSKVNISPRNTFYFIPQEKITKLVDLKPKERLDTLLASLGLYDLKEAIEKLRADLKKHLERKKELEEKINNLEHKIEEYKQLLRSTEMSLKTLRNYYVYRLALLFRKLKELEEEEKHVKTEKEQAEATLHSYIEFVAKVPDQIARIDNEIENLQRRKVSIKDELLNIEKEESSINDKIKILTRKLSSLSAKRNEVMEAIHRILDKWGVKSIEDLQSLLDDKKARLRDLESALERFGETQQMRKIEAHIQQKERELREIEIIRKDYINKIEEVIEEIDPSGTLSRIYRFVQREGLSDEVFGPAILEISFPIPEDKFWGYSRVFERILREKISEYFVALSWRALTRILEFIKKVGIANPPPIFFFGSRLSIISAAEQYAFFMRKSIEEIDREYEEYKKEVLRRLNDLPEYRKKAFLALIPDILAAPKPILAMIKIVFGRIALVSSFEHGLELLSHLDLDGVITLEGEFIERIPCGERYAVYRVMPAIKDEAKLIIQKVRQLNIKNFRQRNRELLEAIEMIKREINEQRKLLEDLRKSLPRRLRNMFEEHMRLKESIAKLEEDISFLEKARSERMKLPNQIRELEIQLEKLDEKLRALSIRKQRLEEELRNVDVKIIELEQKKEALIRERGKRKVEIDELKEKLTEIRIRIEAIESKKNNLLRDIENLKKEIRALLMAIWASIYGQTDLNIDELLIKEIIEPATVIINRFDAHQLEEILSRYSEKDIESLRYDLITREEKIRLLEETLKQLEKYQRELQSVELEIESSRKLAAKSLKKLITKLNRKVNELNKNYQYVLSKIGAKGEIKLEGKEIDNLRLLITIDLHRPKPVEISAGAFSSGEKTLAIFAFLMALFLTSPTPIILLDEFDVYLDESMVRKAVEILRKVLADMRFIQCILTTTHRWALIKIADKIIHLVYDNTKKLSYSSEIDKQVLENIVRRGSSARIL